MKNYAIIALFAFGLVGCKATPFNVCDAYPGHYPVNYTYLPDEISPIVRIEPRYPEEAEKNKIEGYVELSFTVVNGNVKDIKVVESSPEEVFEESAIAALRRWKYKETYKNCVQFPKEYQMKQRLDFGFNS